MMRRMTGHGRCWRRGTGWRVVLCAIGLIAHVGIAGAARADVDLPDRPGARVETTAGVPHTQIGVQAVPGLNRALLRRVSALPLLDVRPTVIGPWGTQGFWLLEGLALARPEAIFHAREFAHLHEDGSLHASLPPDRARAAVDAGWATPHPSSQFHGRLAGFVMLHTPRTMDEIDIVFGLIVDGYNFVTGLDLRAQDVR